MRATIGLAGQFAAVDENLTGHGGAAWSRPAWSAGPLQGLRPGPCHRAARALRPGRRRRPAGWRAPGAACGAGSSPGGHRWCADRRSSSSTSPPRASRRRSRIELWKMMRSWSREGTAVLLTTRCLEEAARGWPPTSRSSTTAGSSPTAPPAELKATMGGTVLALTFDDPGQAAQAAGILERSASKRPRLDGTDVELISGRGHRRGHRHAARARRRRPRARPAIRRSASASLDDVFLAITGRRASLDENEGRRAHPTRAHRPATPGAPPRPPPPDAPRHVATTSRGAS